MNNAKAISKMLIFSERIRELLLMKQELHTLSGSKEFVRNRLNGFEVETCMEIDIRVSILKEEILRIYQKLIDFNPKYHLAINYISEFDVSKGHVDITNADIEEDTYVLNLRTGELEYFVGN